MSRHKAPCLYCGESYEFIAGVHFKREDHFGGSNAFQRYKTWVAEEYDIDPSHEVFSTPGALTRPKDFTKYDHLFE